MAMERIGIDDIKAGYLMYKDCPYYAIFERANATSGKTGRLLFAFKEGDRHQGWDELKQNLAVLQATASQVPHIIQFYDELGKNGRIDTTTPYNGSFVFRMEKYVPAMNGMGGVGPTADNSFLLFLQQELAAERQKSFELEQTVRELEEEVEDLSKEPKQEITGLIGQIGEAGNQFPWLSSIISDWSTVLKHKVTGGGGSAQRRPAGANIAGVTEAAQGTAQERIAQAENTMMKWYARQYGDLNTAEGRMKGVEAFAGDMDLLARLTQDDDMMLLALKKLRALE